MRCFTPHHLRSSYQAPPSLLWFEPAADRLPGTSCGCVRICAQLDAQRGSECGGENSMHDDARIDKSRENDAQLGLGCSEWPNSNNYSLGRITPTNTNPRIVCVMPLRPPSRGLANPTSCARRDWRTWLALLDRISRPHILRNSYRTGRAPPRRSETGILAERLR